MLSTQPQTQNRSESDRSPFVPVQPEPGVPRSGGPDLGPSYGQIPGAAGTQGAVLPANHDAAAAAFQYMGESPQHKGLKAASSSDVSPAMLRTAMAEGGQPLPESVSGQMSQWFGEDFANVRVHLDTRSALLANAMGAEAFAFGSNLFFGDGQFAPDTPRGKQLIAHELTHVVQNRGQTPDPTDGRAAQAGQSRISVGSSSSAAEHEARAVAETFEKGGAKPPLSLAHSGPIIQRSDAAVHKDMELQVSEVEHAPNLFNPFEREPGSGSRTAGALEIYSGNWTNDLTQLKVPGFYGMLGDELKLAHEPGQPVTGLQIESVMNGLLKAMAILEFGTRIGENATAGDKLVPYQPQDHIDNPVGLRSEDLLIKDSELRPVLPVQSPKLRMLNHGKPLPLPDTARDQQLKGAALPGRQVDNPELYKVSAAGLSKHIYNSIETAKNFWMQAAEAGPTPEGRRLLGRGMHIVEDYFAHSNFIEVALNDFIEFALQHQNDQSISQSSKQFAERVADPGHGVQPRGQHHGWVDTLYDPRQDHKSTVGATPRQAITTGTFGPDDTRVSIAHLIVPMLPKVNAALEMAVDPMMELISKNADVQMTFPAFLKQLSARSRPGAAMAALLSGLDGGGVVVPVPSLAFGLPPVDFKTREPLVQAFSTYSSIYNAVPGFVREIALALMKDQLRTSLHSGVHSLLVAITGFITGEDTAKLQGLDDNALLKKDEETEARLIPKTEMGRRLGPGGDLEGMAPEDRELSVGSGKDAPSHSRINKDHPDSLFFGLHKALAMEADRHILEAMQSVWQGRGSLFGDGAHFAPNTAAGHDLVSSEATRQSTRARKLYSQDMPGSSFAQGDAKNQSALKDYPGLGSLLNLADLFISHPNDSTWWRAVVSSYIAMHADEVTQHILARNRGQTSLLHKKP